MKKNYEFILSEHDRTGTIVKKTRIKLVNCLSQLIDESYAGSATVTEIRAICEATIKMFPCLQGPNGGIVRRVSLFVAFSYICKRILTNISCYTLL